MSDSVPKRELLLTLLVRFKFIAILWKSNLENRKQSSFLNTRDNWKNLKTMILNGVFDNNDAEQTTAACDAQKLVFAPNDSLACSSSIEIHEYLDDIKANPFFAVVMSNDHLAPLILPCSTAYGRRCVELHKHDVAIYFIEKIGFVGYQVLSTNQLSLCAINAKYKDTRVYISPDWRFVGKLIGENQVGMEDALL